MTSLDQNAADRPHVGADRPAAEAGSTDAVVVDAMAAEVGPTEAGAAEVAEGVGASGVTDLRSGSAAPGVAGWSSGAWGAGVLAADRVRPPRRPAPSRRLSQVRAVLPAQGRPGADGGAEPIGAGAEPAGGSVDLPGVPMGVLIGGSPGSVEGAAPVGRAPDRRVSAQLLRFGSGTCQVVLPEWRPAIAVSVPTEQLQRSTGLSAEELRSALLSVVINPEAVHDRELGLHDWQAEVPAVRGRRRGRRQVR